jgi:acetyl-CoA C-acetyltransferase
MGDLPGVPGAAITPKSNDPGEILLMDSMLYDGLRDIYDLDLPHMGELADRCAKVHGISRDEQEAYAFASFSRALEAEKSGVLGPQIVPVAMANGVTEFDECVYEPDMARWKNSKPAFLENGTVIAGTSSQISDGAAALLIASELYVKQFKQEPLARIVNFFVHSGDPDWYTTAPANAIRNLIFKTNAGLPSGSMIRIQDIDLFEINEAFAVVPLYAMRELGIPHEKVNIWGGAIALGHPIGASGARITGNLVHQLVHTGGRYGIAVACNGGGEAVAVLIENMQRR